MKRPFFSMLACSACWLSMANAYAASAADFASLQEALDANPGRTLVIPDGDHVLTQRLRITGAGTVLCGYGRLVQSNPAEPVLDIDHASRVRIENITITRAEGAQDAESGGLVCRDSADVDFVGIRVEECRAREAAIQVRDCVNVTVRDSVVRNYKRIAVDDRTESELYGYAFRCIDGTGILVERSTGTMIVGNRIIEERLLPTRELKEQHQLGSLTEGKRPTRAGQLGQEPVRRGYANNWHQGSAIVITSPEVTRHTMVRGNHLINAAQGVDIHSDDILVTENVVDHGLIGIKATHGCRNLTIANNLLTHVDLWGILLNPGAASHAAEAATADSPSRAANVDAGIVVANNQICDYGYGHEYWNYGGASDTQSGSYAIALFEGQLETNPPLRDVIVTGNIVYDTGRDGLDVDGKVAAAPPRYRYAVYVGPWGETGQPGPTHPQGILFSNNLLHPGTKGIANIEMAGP